jgi:ribosome-associated protein
MIKIPTPELQFSFMRAPGPGGQNVNKLATAVELRWDVKGSSSLSEDRRARLISLAGKKMTLGGELIIKASRYRTQERNKQDALDRLQALLIRAATVQKKRKETKPTFSSKQKRLASKKIQGKVKSLRGKPKQED